MHSITLEIFTEIWLPHNGLLASGAKDKCRLGRLHCSGPLQPVPHCRPPFYINNLNHDVRQSPFLSRIHLRSHDAPGFLLAQITRFEEPGQTDLGRGIDENRDVEIPLPADLEEKRNL